MEKLEKEKKPIHAIRVISEISGRVYGRKGDFYISVRKEIEKIYKELKVKKVITKEVIEKLREINKRISRREEERKRFGEIYPVLEVLKNYFGDGEKIQETSKEILENLKSGNLLKKDNFFKESRRKKIRRIIREKLIDSFGYVENLDEIEGKIFTNLEGEYG